MAVRVFADFLRVGNAGVGGIEGGASEWRLDFQVSGGGQTERARFSNNDVDPNEIFPLGFEFTIDDDFNPNRLILLDTFGFEEDPLRPDDTLPRNQTLITAADLDEQTFQTTARSGEFSYTVDWFLDVV